MKKSTRNRMELLKSMHNIMLHMNNEDCYYRWINFVPDEPDEDDFESIAENNEMFHDYVQVFGELFSEYWKDGGMYIA